MECKIALPQAGETSSSTIAPALMTSQLRAATVVPDEHGAVLTSCMRHGRTKYYGVHLGEPDIATTPFKDEPLMVHRRVLPPHSGHV